MNSAAESPPYRLVVLAQGISPPGTMGGNSKIILEVIRALAPVHPCLVITSRAETFRRNGVTGSGITIAEIPAFSGHPLRNHVAMCRHYVREVRAVFQQHGVGPGDQVYSTCDGWEDVLPGYLLKREFGFAWVPTLYLFVPSLLENLRRRYGFPALKYVAYHAYQRLTFRLILARGDRFVITNDADRCHFPRRLQERVLAIYGGVNCEQIRQAAADLPQPQPRFDALFCSRLHPQKGVEGLLEAWRLVTAQVPGARLGLIGNGEPAYEAWLRDRARALGIAGSLEWLGYVNDVEKFRLYRQARVFVHATVFDNNGMVAAEALCSGLPVVLFDLPALRHVYTDGCVKVPPGDRAAYAAAVVALLRDPVRYAQVRPTADQLEALQRRWDWPVRARLFDEFLRGP